MNLDDPKLTAYALGEISDPAEKSQIETWLAWDADGRAFVADTREMATLLSQKLRASTSTELTSEQRAAILAGHREEDNLIAFTAEPEERPTPHHRSWSVVALAALAACLALGPLLPWTELLRLRQSSAPTVAFNEKPMTLQMPVDEMNKEKSAKNLALEDPQPSSKLTSKSELNGSKAMAKPADKLDRSEIADQSVDLRVPQSEMPVPQEQQSTATAAAPSASNKDEMEIRREKPQLDAPRRAAPVGKMFEGENSGPSNTEAYDSIAENEFLTARENPLSTFSIDVDTASYANLRRMLNAGQLPPKGAVRIEEMLNYFTYDYAKPEGDRPFSTALEVATCPWQPEHRLVRIGMKGREIPPAARKAANLVFLIDVSGSMDEPNKLPLLKQSLRLLIDQLGENDRVALATYAGQSGLVLPSTSNKNAIREALENLQAGGGTNGASGIQLAYQQAAAHFEKDGVNRVILATDGDFNVGITSQSDLTDLIAEKAKSGVFLSVLGFGTGNLKDSTMEKLADKGNGNYAYIDSLREGKKVLVEQMGGTLVTIAKDVKIQVEFNPALVSNYRLIGYENRALKKEDFADDKKDAGEIGAGHTVTALYEVVMVGSMSPEVQAEPLKYSKSAVKQDPVLPRGEMLTVSVRYKEPDGNVSKKLEFPLKDDGRKLNAASPDFQFASAVAEFGQLLRKSAHSQLASWESTISRANQSKGEDPGGYRAEFVELVKKAEILSRRTDS